MGADLLYPLGRNSGGTVTPGEREVPYEPGATASWRSRLWRRRAHDRTCAPPSRTLPPPRVRRRPRVLEGVASRFATSSSAHGAGRWDRGAVSAATRGWRWNRIGRVIGAGGDVTGNAAVTGVAMLAGWEAGIYRDVDDAISRCVHLSPPVEPDPRTRAHYDGRFAAWRELAASSVARRET